MKEYTDYTRWVSDDCKVWEKRSWGWKFLGIAKSQAPIHILELPSHDCDHPADIFFEGEINEKIL